MLAAKLRQLRFALKAKPVTLAYPCLAHPSEEGFRGRVVVDTDKCVGCAGCADVFPARCIRVTDCTPTLRVIRRYLERCLHCGRCETACAYDSVRLTGDYELATPARADLLVEQRIFMGICDRCGRCYVPKHPLDRPAVSGWRQDEPELAEGSGNGPRSASGADEPEGGELLEVSWKP
jgi:formate hydrogenlyase subunit 6/NADH:ubiquinone oxidoreductase subunit I